MQGFLVLGYGSNYEYPVMAYRDPQPISGVDYMGVKSSKAAEFTEAAGGPATGDYLSYQDAIELASELKVSFNFLINSIKVSYSS